MNSLDFENKGHAVAIAQIVMAATTPFFERRELLRASFFDKAMFTAIKKWHDDNDYFLFLMPQDEFPEAFVKLYADNPNLENQLDAFFDWLNRDSSFADHDKYRAETAWGMLFANLYAKRQTVRYPNLPHARLVELQAAADRLYFEPGFRIKDGFKDVEIAWSPFGKPEEIAARAAAMIEDDRVIYIEYLVDRGVSELHSSLTLSTHLFRDLIDWYVDNFSAAEKEAFYADSLNFAYEHRIHGFTDGPPLRLEAIQDVPLQSLEGITL